MRFGPVPLTHATGAILAHSASLRGGRLAKGRVLTDADIARLAAEGWSDVIVARPGPDDVPEDAAAARVAASIATTAAGLRAGPAATGRANLYACGPGIVGIDAAAVTALNAIDPALTLATLPPWRRVAEGGMVGTVKIIAYAVPAASVARAEATAAGAMTLHPPVFRTAHLIETSVGDAPGDKGRRALATRLARLGVALRAGRQIVAHDTTALAGALTDAPGDMLFVLTGSATSDPGDVGPAALRAAGGTVERFGIPVDPGNLLFLGHLGDRPVIGLPGCARSPALNGADWVLERVICGMPPAPADFAAMGVGGLLKEIPSRPRPREG